MRPETPRVRALTAAFFDAQGGRIVAELSERLGQAGSLSLLPIYRTLLDLVTGHIRDASPPRLIAGVRRALSGFEGDVQAIIPGQTVLWTILHRMLREVEGPHRNKDAIYAVLTLAGDALDGVTGALIDISLSGRATVSPEGWRILVELGRTHREGQMLNRAIGDLLDARELGQMFEILERAIMDTFHLRSLVITTVSQEEGLVEVVRGRSVFPQNPDHLNMRIDLSHPDILSDVARTGRTEVIDGWDPRYHEWVVRPDGGLVSVQKPKDFNAGQTAFFVPILIRDRVIGIVCTGSTQEGKPDVLLEIERMRPFLHQVGATLSVVSEIAERKRAEEALQQALRREAGMGRIRDQVLDMRRLSDFPAMLQGSWMEEMRGLGIPVNDVSIEFPAPKPGHFQHLPDALGWRGTPHVRSLADCPWVKEVWERGKPVVVPRERFEGLGFDPDVQCILEVPLPGVQGSLGVNSRTVDAFGEEAIRTVQMFAGLVAEGLQRVQDFDALQQSETRLNLALDAARMGVWDLDLLTDRLIWSEPMEALFGLAPGAFAGTREAFYELVHPEDQEVVRRAVGRAVEEGVDFEVEHRILRPNGAVRWIASKGQIIRDGSGRAAHMLGAVVDITDRKRAEEERIRLSRAVEQAAESIMITDTDGTIVYVNPAFERVSGYSREEAVGQNPRLLKSGRQDAAFYREMWNTLARGEVWTGRFINRRKDGGLYEEEAVISPVRDTTGKVVNYVAAKRDVTQEAALEAQLRQAQKMDAVGTLAGGIAHDFNNILTSIIGFSQMALMEEGLDPSVREFIAQIPDQGKRAAQLISQLLTFSRKAVTERQPVSLDPLVKETVKMLERTLPESIAIRLRASGEAWMVNADPTQMQQVVMNLCINAGQAMPYGGEMAVSLENVTLDDAYCRQYAYARPGRHVLLSVRDTGVGMTPEVQARIFEPFYTTKEVGKGTGLGLATVYGIVKGHEGHVNVYSEVGKGSEFKVYLPAMEAETGRRVAPVKERLAGGTETLLLVEDHEAVRVVGRTMLERLGYVVLTVSNGEEALEVYRAHRGEIALVLTDMVMPKMGGDALYDALREMDPSVKALMMSGYSVKQDLSDLQARGLRGFVQKPLDFHKLGQAVRRALDGA